MAQLMLFSGNATPDLSKKVSDYLAVPLGNASVGRFSDGEIAIEIAENVRGQDVFVLQSTCAPTNDNLMELIVMCDALRRASASRITAVVPYFGYARQDRRPRSARVPITAKVVADIMVGVGIDRVLTVDLHADQIQGFFDVAVDNIYATPVMLEDIQRHQPKDVTVVSPDVGGVLRARVPAEGAAEDGDPRGEPDRKRFDAFASFTAVWMRLSVRSRIWASASSSRCCCCTRSASISPRSSRETVSSL